MKVGVLELLALPAQNLPEKIYQSTLSKQFVSITPQIISVWCRQAGHETFYATYYGFGKIEKLLPTDLDVVFIACQTQVAPLAYVFAEFYRKGGATTVIGGAHAKSFPADCLRFFDLVVDNCDRDLILRIVAGDFAPGSFISSAKSFNEFPGAEAREDEIRTAVFFQKRWRDPVITIIPTMSSMGCPYTCDFCTDWNSTYQVLPMARVVEDMKFVARTMPGAVLGFSEPNFAVKFDQVFDAIESIPPDMRVPFVMECTLSILNEQRVARLKRTNCLYALLGIDSWSDYAGKSGLTRKHSAEDKLARVISLFHLAREGINYIQATFVFGVDADKGDEPVAMTKEFMRETPYAWPALNIPIPFGGTPLQERMLAEGRILKAMPFILYAAPNLAVQLKHYDPVDYFEKLVDMSSFMSSDAMLKQRLQSTPNFRHKLVHRIRTAGEKVYNRQYRETLHQLRSDAQFLAFHEGRSNTLPDYYKQQAIQKLGRYAALFPEVVQAPDLSLIKPLVVEGSHESTLSYDG